MKSSLSLSLIILSLLFLWQYTSVNPRVSGMNFMQIFQSDACPPAHPEAELLVEKFLTSGSFETDRQNTGTGSLEADRIRLLEDAVASDVPVCKQLRSVPMYNPGDTTYRATAYYRVDQFYFVSMPVTRETVMRDGEEVKVTEWSYLSILDSGLNFIQTVAINNRFHRPLAGESGPAGTRRSGTP